MYKLKWGKIEKWDTSRPNSCLLSVTVKGSKRGSKTRRIFYHKLALALFSIGLNPWLGTGNETILVQVRNRDAVKTARRIRVQADNIYMLS